MKVNLFVCLFCSVNLQIISTLAMDLFVTGFLNHILVNLKPKHVFITFCEVLKDNEKKTQIFFFFVVCVLFNKRCKKCGGGGSSW